MLRIIPIVICSTLFFGSCSTSKQYTVYAINQTKRDIRVIISDRDTYENSITLGPNERKQIISTDLIETDELRTKAEDCKSIADAITAVNSEGVRSSIRWCSCLLYTSPSPRD